MQNRETWGSRAGFILAAVGSAIGLGNIWRFPYMAYENGGGAFLLPYFIAMLAAGIPFMILEFGLGHKFKGSAPKIFSTISSKMEWLGWFQVIVCFIIATYYVAVIGWSMQYFLLSFTQGWGATPSDFFFKDFLGLSSGPMNLGELQMPIFLAVVVAWGVAYFAIFTGIRGGIERLNKIFMPLLFLMVLVFIGFGMTLEGASEGLQWLFKPDFAALAQPKVWTAAAGQIFFSLSIGFAIMLAYSSYLPKDSDISNNATMTVFINCGFSMLAGVMIFSVLGYMAAQKGVPVSEVVSSGVGLAFITLPTAINMMPMPVLFGVLFFLALTIAGLSSMISIVEAIVSAVMDKLNMPRKQASTLICGLGFIISVVYTTGGGLYLLDIVDHFINNYGILVGGLIEICFVAWFCKLDMIQKHINATSEFAVGNLWKLCIMAVAPFGLAVNLVIALYEDLTVHYSGYDFSALLMFGWLMLAAALVLALAMTCKQCAFKECVSANNDFRRK
ncbi:sodium-dependent transporter [Salidesulfovibrio onnuriiensis]|uniref:sodium-dependent transporter n=1 Tax=Salidesulfovibrio onnuriiensis TaxID=2583823 RepID=UPI0011C8E2CD|nr:sodium-dependent transporter [Salidesulfovibrio onnuriiensis]